MSEFHFLRPWWWLCWPLLAWLVWSLWQHRPRAGAWSAVCDAHLLRALLSQGAKSQRRGWALAILGLGGTLTIAALAGPVWKRAPQAVYRAHAAQVIVLGLAQSMDATDIAPSRLARARLKVLDLLQKFRDEQVALIAYAGSAHVVAPLTDDVKTVANLVPVLSTDLMPDPGARLDLALEQAGAMLQRQGIPQGHVIIVGDDAGDDNALLQVRMMRTYGHRVSVLAVGTPQGSPIPRAGGGYIKNAQGVIMMPRLDEQGLMELSNTGGGVFVRMRADDADIDALTTLGDPSAKRDAREDAETRKSDQWIEQGPWLLLLVLPLATLGFRRGVLLNVIVLASAITPRPSYAFDWDDLWLRRDQQAQRLMDSAQPARAAELFDDARWRGVANYRAGKFDAASGNFDGKDAETQYNRGNALALSGKIDEAIAAYEQTLKQQPDHEDAKYNLDLLKKLQQQQPNSQQGGEQDQQSSSSEQQGREQDSSGKVDKKKEKGERQNGDQNARRGEQSGQPQPAKPDQEQEPGQTAQGQHQQTQQSPQARQPGEAQEDSEQEKERYMALQLRRVPDDPGGLLRQKFLREQQRRRMQTETMR